MRLIKTLALNTLIILVILYLISWLGSLMLSSYTRHGESLTLPNLKGLGFEEVQQILDVCENDDESDVETDGDNVDDAQPKKTTDIKVVSSVCDTINERVKFANNFFAS